ncbi:hypothetical protein [Nocardia sp. NPDC057440]|uniref:hypothetical protein n=1 Tax=Nocardia sp. NPDC057440 TaxID=3346134 RepID=UPI003671547C
MRRTPQEKKQLSYTRDRRNTYGENDKASRKNIPRSRAQAHRANRHFDAQTLKASTGPVDAALADRAEQQVRVHRRRIFRKRPDTALGEYVKWKLIKRNRLTPRHAVTNVRKADPIESAGTPPGADDTSVAHSNQPFKRHDPRASAAQRLTNRALFDDLAPAGPSSHPE